MVTKLEIQGFKSFTNKTSLSFPTSKNGKFSITCIIGPNGSGKSNIVDAFKWVLGEQRTKSVRIKQRSDLIFSGSQKHPRLGFAEISIYLDNSQNKIPLDYSQIVITRRLYRNGESEYFINKNLTTLNEILTLLAKAQFGQKSYSIITQGQINHIIVATPLERKNFFDEAVGIKEYLIKRQKSLNKLERTEENLEKINIRLTEIEPRLKFLEKQAKKIKQKEKIERQLRLYQILFFTNKENKLSNELQTIEKAIRELTAKEKIQQNKLKELQQILNNIEKQNTKFEEITLLQKKYQKLQFQKNEIEKQKSMLQGRIDANLESQGKIDLIWVNKKEQDIKDELKRIKNEIQISKQNKIHYENILKEKQTQLTKLKNKIKKIETIDYQFQKNIKLDHIEKLINNIIEKINKEIILISKNNINTIDKMLLFLQKTKKELVKIIPLLKTINKQSNKKDSLNTYTQPKIEEYQKSITELTEEINNLLVKIKLENQKNILLENEQDKYLTELKSIQENYKQYQDQATDKKTEMITKFKKQILQLDNNINLIENKQLDIQKKINQYHLAQQEQKERFFKLEKKYNTEREILSQIQHKKNQKNIEKTKIDTLYNTLTDNIRKDLNISIEELKKEALYKNKELQSISNIDNYELENKIQKLKNKLIIIGSIDSTIEQEYSETNKTYKFLKKQKEDLKETLNSLEKIIKELDKSIREKFNENFKKINKEFQKYFKKFFSGGTARLDILKEDSLSKEDVDESLDQINKNNKISKKFHDLKNKGIDIFACPPGKKLRNIEMLSGGEKSLTALALISAIITVNPSPFVIFDEVDAALDEANSQKMANIIKELSKKTQFIIITHNRTIMNIADCIYGVTMGKDGISKLLSVQFEELDKHTARL